MLDEIECLRKVKKNRDSNLFIIEAGTNIISILRSLKESSSYPAALEVSPYFVRHKPNYLLKNAAGPCLLSKPFKTLQNLNNKKIL